MSDLLLIPICILAGILLSRYSGLPEDSYRILNNIIIYLTLPALTIYYIPQLMLNYDLIFPALAVWITFILAVIFFSVLQKIFKWSRSVTGALILTAGLANTSFVGFPVLMALFGEEGLIIGVVLDQAGSFLVLSSLGIIIASIYSSGILSFKKAAINTLLYPSFIAFIISIVMIISGIKHSPGSLSLFSKLGSPTIMLALISIGMQLKINVKEITWKELSVGLFYKLIISPLIIFILYFYLFNVTGLEFQVSVIETAMPPMVMGSVLASQYELQPKLANLMVGIGIPVSVVTLTIWYLLISV